MATYPKMTLADLRTAARQRADMVHSQFVSDAELNSYVNASYFELYDLLVQKYGNDYFVSESSFPLVSGTAKYALPADFYKLLGVDLQVSGGDDNYVSLRPFTMAERNRYAPVTGNWLGVSSLRYRISGDDLWFTPTPDGGQQVRLWYVPRLAALQLDTDVADGVSGWLEYVVTDAAIKMLQKEESDTSVLLAQKGALIKRIESAAENRDAGSPARVSDTQLGGGWPYGWGYGGPA